MKAIFCLCIALTIMLGAAATAGANTFNPISNLIEGLDGINDIWLDGKKLVTDILNYSGPANVVIKDKMDKKGKKGEKGVSIPDIPAVVLLGTLMIVVGIVFRKKIFRKE